MSARAKVLVTGTDGFIGGAIGEGLAALGHEVRGTVFLREPRGREVRVDVTRDDGLAALEDATFDAVVHTVGIVDQSAPARLMRAVNADGARRVAAWARARSVAHFIHISSAAAYGFRVSGQNRTEARTPRMRGLVGVPYMKTKAAAERHVEASGIPATILRLPAVLGPSDTVLTPSIVERLRVGWLPRRGFTDRLVSLLAVRNLVDIVARLVEVGPQRGAFNCACHDVPWDVLVAAYAEALDLPLGWRDQPLPLLLAHLGDTAYLFTYMQAAFGGHFPSGALFGRIGYRPRLAWRDAVAEAARAAASKTPERA